MPATELVCVLRFRRQQLAPSPDRAAETAADESLRLSHVESSRLAGMIHEDLQAKRAAIDSYRSVVRNLGDSDPATRRVMERTLVLEEEHAALIHGFAVQLHAQLSAPELTDE